MDKHQSKRLDNQDEFVSLKQPTLYHASFQQKIHYSALVTQAVIQFIQAHQISSIAIYWPEPDQINSLGIIQYCFDHHLQVYVYNWDKFQHEFEFLLIHSFELETYHADNYINLDYRPDRMEKPECPLIDLLIVPVYFADQQRALYYGQKDYGKVSFAHHHYLIGIGYQNLCLTHACWNFLLYDKKIMHLTCDALYFASDLITTKD